MLKDRLYQISMVLAIVMGVAGVPLLTSTGCDQMFIQDPVTGELREATPDEELDIRGKMIDTAVEQASFVMASTGHPEYIPFAQLGGQLAMALTALFINKKRNGLPPPKKKK